MTIAAILLLGYGILWIAARGAIFHPTAHPGGDWDWGPALGAQEVSFESSDSLQLHGWLFDRPDASLTTLFLHGNAGNLTHRKQHIQAILSAGSAVFIVDYRGYGKSRGTPSETGLYRDAEAAYQWLIDNGRPPDSIVVHGESLGTAVAVRLASRKPPAGVVLEAPFPSARAVAHEILPWVGPLLVSGFETAAEIRNLRRPVLVIHGDRDCTIPHRLGRDVFEAANQPKSFWTVEGAGHNDLVHRAGPLYPRRLREFYSSLSG